MGSESGYIKLAEESLRSRKLSLQKASRSLANMLTPRKISLQSNSGHVIRLHNSCEFLEKEQEPFLRTTQPQEDDQRHVTDANTTQSATILEMYVRCEKLPKTDVFSTTHPVCVLSIKKSDQWVEHARTEIIFDCNYPKFVRSFTVTVSGSSDEELKFEVFNAGNQTPKAGQKLQLIGEGRVQGRSLLSRKNVRMTLRSPDMELTGELHVGIEEPRFLADSRLVSFELAARNLEKREMFAKVNAFFEINRTVAGQLHPLYRSEVVHRNSNPKWKRFQIPEIKLCGGNPNETLFLQVWYHNPTGGHQKSYTTETTLNELLRPTGNSLRLRRNSTKKSDFLAIQHEESECELVLNCWVE